MSSAASPSPRPSAAIVIACLALGLSGIAIGILLGRSLALPVPAVHADESSAAQVDLAPVLAELRQIKEALLSQGSRSERSERTTETGAPAASVDPHADRLDAEIGRLKSELDRVEEQRGSTSSTISRWKGPGHPSLDSMFAFVVARMKVPEGATEDSEGQVLSVVGDEVVEELTRAHILWTRNDVFDRYGTPSHVRAPETGIDYFYSRLLNPDRRIEIGFHVKDGVVTVVWAE